MTHVFLSAPYSRKEQIRRVAQECENVGAEVISDWHLEPYSPNMTLTDVPDSFLSSTACKDFHQVRCCHVFIFFAESSTTPTVRGGRHVEFGMALCSDCEIWVIGEKENIFHHLPNIIHFANEEQCLEALEALCKQ